VLPVPCRAPTIIIVFYLFLGCACCNIQPCFGPLAGGTVLNLSGSWPEANSSYGIDLVYASQPIGCIISWYRLVNYIQKQLDYYGVLHVLPADK